MTSLGTWRLVMPRSESTIASAGPAASSASKDGPDLVAVGQQLEPGEDRAQPVVGAEVGGGQRVAVAGEGLGEEGPHDVAEDDRVGHLHHRGLQVHREEHVLGLGPGDLGRRGSSSQRGHPHDRRVHDLAGLDRHRLAQHGDRAVGRRPARCGASPASVTTADRSVERKSPASMWTTRVFELGRPGAHPVGVGPGVGLHRRRRPAVGVPLAEHRVDRAALDLVVAGPRCRAPRRTWGRRGSRGGRSPWPAARRWPP